MFSIKFSYDNSIQDSVLISTLKVSNYNIRTWYFFLRPSNSEPSLYILFALYLSLAKEQYSPLVKKNFQVLGIRDILVRQRKLDCLLCIKAHWCLVGIITLSRHIHYHFQISALLWPVHIREQQVSLRPCLE